MSLIQDFADWWKRRDVRIRKWYSDGQGRFAFRVTLDGQAFVCTTRSSNPHNGKTSVMKRVAGIAQTNDALVVVRVPHGLYVFDPVVVLAEGESDEPTERDRRKRGEEWVSIDVDYACDFSDWYDGVDEPVTYDRIGNYQD